MELGTFNITGIKVYKKGLFRNKLVATIDSNGKSDNPNIYMNSLKRKFDKNRIYIDKTNIFRKEKSIGYLEYSNSYDMINEYLLSKYEVRIKTEKIGEIKLMMNDENLRIEIEAEKEKIRIKRNLKIQKILDRINKEIKNDLIENKEIC